MCVSPSQKDWVTKLPAIELATNAARSEVTGYAPFFLNDRRVPRALLWNSPKPNEYPSARTYANNMKNAVISAHDSILEHRVKESRTADRKRTPSPFKTGDLAYVSTKNTSIPKGLARKLAPKYAGTCIILAEYNGTSLKVDLSPQPKKRGIHDVFHASLLRIHIPNDDRLFPGRSDSQIWNFDEEEDREWMVECIATHSNSKTNSMFNVLWKSGGSTWLPHHQVSRLLAFKQYLELIGISGILKPVLCRFTRNS